MKILRNIEKKRTGDKEVRWSNSTFRSRHDHARVSLLVKAGLYIVESTEVVLIVEDSLYRRHFS